MLKYREPRFLFCGFDENMLMERMYQAGCEKEHASFCGLM